MLLVGCGRMGSALLSGWLAAGLVHRAWVVEPVGPGDAPADPRVIYLAALAALPGGVAPDVVVLAVKPQLMDRVAPAYRDLAAAGAVVLSIAAGKTLAVLARDLGPAAAIVRSMPNTPAAIGRGITVCVGNERVTPAQRARCTGLLGAVGAVEWVADEALLDPVTAVSGSGPAYVFLLIEALAAAGAAAGLPADLAMRLARATVCGAAALAQASPESAEELRRGVTSPAGTTEAALRVLMAPAGLPDLLDRAVAAAARRSVELAG